MVGFASRESARRKRPSLVSIAIAAFTAATLSSCEFVTTTPVEPYLTYAVAEIDLDGRLPDKVDQVEVRTLALGDESYAAFFVRADRRADNDELIVVDNAFRLRVERDDQFPIRLTLGGSVSEAGELLFGNLLFDPAAQSITNSAAPENEYFVGEQIGANYYTLNEGNLTNAIGWEEFTNAFIPQGNANVQLSAGGILDDEARLFAHNYVASDGSRSIVIISGNEALGRFVTTVPMADLPTLTGPLFNEANLTASAYPTVLIAGGTPRRTFKTREGIFTWEDDGTLERYDADTGDRLDSFQLGRFAEGGLSNTLIPAFFVTGERYLLLDTERRKLYEVAPWW